MNTHRFILVLVISLVTVSLAACGGPEPETGNQTDPVPVETQPAERPTAAAPPADESIQQSVSGELQDVDLAASTFTIRNTEGNSETFLFTEATRIVGTVGTQGLSTQQGSQVTVGYMDQDGRKMAVRIEIVSR